MVVKILKACAVKILKCVNKTFTLRIGSYGTVITFRTLVGSPLALAVRFAHARVEGE